MGAKVVTYLGSLVQLCCEEGGTLQTNITGMCGVCSQCLGCTGFAPAHSVCVFIVDTAQAPGCFAGELSKVGPGLHALPRSKQFRFRFLGTPERCRLGCSSLLSLSFSLLSSLSLWLFYSLGCYLTLAPSDCPQGIQARSLP